MNRRVAAIAALVTLGALAPIAASAQTYTTVTVTSDSMTINIDDANAVVPANPMLGLGG